MICDPASIKKYVEHLRDEGFCIIERLIPEDRVDQIREDVEAGHQQATADYEAWGGSLGFQTGPNGERGKNVVAYVSTLSPYFGDERVLGIAQTMLDPHVRISQTEFKTRPPNDTRADFRAWHTDFPHDLTDREEAGSVMMPFPNVTMGLTTLWLLSPFAPNTGGTWVVPHSHRDLRNPRSHLNPKNPPELYDDIPVGKPIPGEKQLSGPAGSVAIIDSRIWHSNAANPSPDPRVTVLARYSPWWLGLEFGGRNNAIVPRETYKAMPDAVKLLYRHRAEGQSDPIRHTHAFKSQRDG